MDVCGIFLLALMVSIHNILSTHKEISFFLFFSFISLVWSPVALSFSNFSFFLSLLIIILLSVLCRRYIYLYFDMCFYVSATTINIAYILQYTDTWKPSHTSNELFFLFHCVFHTILAFFILRSFLP